MTEMVKVVVAMFLTLTTLVNVTSEQTELITYNNKDCKYITEGVNVRETLLNVSNNTKYADEIITKEYEEKELMQLSPNIDVLLSEKFPECVRVINDGEMAYFVYKSNKKHYAFYLCELNNDKRFVTAMWYCGKPILLEEFMTKKGVTYEEVKEFDPYGNYSIALYSSSTTSLYSVHNTVDGYVVKFVYKKTEDDVYVVNDIVVYSDEDNILYHHLLDVDKLLLK